MVHTTGISVSILIKLGELWYQICFQWILIPWLGHTWYAWISFYHIILSIFTDFEGQLHVVHGAGPAHPPVNVPLCCCGDEKIFLSRFELQSTRARTERSKGDGSELSWVCLVTHHHLLRPGVGHPTGHELMLAHTVDHMVLLVVLGTDQMKLIIFLWKVALIHCDSVGVVLVTEQGVGGVPIHIVMLGTHHRGCFNNEDYEEHLLTSPSYLPVLS